jgi:hypothetical protein
MVKTLSKSLLFLLLALAFVPSTLSAFDKKIFIGQPFKYFDLEDIYNQRWISTYLRGKPVIMVTAHRYQKYEVAKWADALRQEFATNGSAHVLWVVNMRKSPWNTSRKTILKEWLDLNPSIPVLMDWNGTIGRALRVNYRVPNIIVLDAYGRLAMHEMHSFNLEVYSAVSARIRTLTAFPIPAYVGAPYTNTAPKGKRGYSN